MIRGGGGVYGARIAIGEKHHLSITWADKKGDGEGTRRKIIARRQEGEYDRERGQSGKFSRIALTLRGRLVADFRFSLPCPTIQRAELCVHTSRDSGNSCITRNRHRGRQP